MWLELYDICKKNNISLNDGQSEQLRSFQEKILEWNKKINLISRKDESNFLVQHIVSSLAALTLFRFSDKCNVLDLGTGGGLPGIPLAIMYPGMEFVLLDSIKKKITAVHNIVTELQLYNVQTICGRAEELSQGKEFHKKFDYVISRAVASVNDLIKWGKPFLKNSSSEQSTDMNIKQKKDIPAGAIIMLKGGDMASEIHLARMKSKPQRIDVHPIVIKGAPELYDKKIVIVLP